MRKKFSRGNFCISYEKFVHPDHIKDRLGEWRT
jgi:hypothetical protein